MSHRIRTDLAAAPPGSRGECLLALAIMSDIQVLDAASPARCEWLVELAADPQWRPLQPMYRPYDSLVHWALAAHVDALRRDPLGRWSRRPFDLALSLGDAIDNAQHNELDTFLKIVAGGRAQLSAIGAAQDADRQREPGDWPFWCPDAAVADRWKPRGYPVVADFTARASAAIDSQGLGFPWSGLPGNHDLMRQGTALPEPDIEAIAVSGSKSLRRPDNLDPQDPLAFFLEQPGAFSRGVSRQVLAHQSRRAVNKQQWIAAHLAQGALGYTAHHAAQGIADVVIDTEQVRIIGLDTNHPAGDYQGSVGSAQLQWLDEQLAQTDAQPGRLAMLASHHGAVSLTNTLGNDPQRHLGAELTRVLHRHPCLVTWLVGHRHVHAVTPHPGQAGGFWEITTGSLIDWPSQTRDIECMRHPDGRIEIVCSLREHAAPPGSLARLHHDMARLAARDFGLPLHAHADHGNVRLPLPARR